MSGKTDRIFIKIGQVVISPLNFGSHLDLELFIFLGLLLFYVYEFRCLVKFCGRHGLSIALAYVALALTLPALLTSLVHPH